MTPELQNIIIKRLSDKSISRVILFGSQAMGLENSGSDIDLLVVTDDDVVPASHREKMIYYQKVRNLIKDLKQDYSIDLLVYTKPVFLEFLESESAFSREIQKKGKVLYEKDIH
jgi:predicted nucleotidyltransferase